MHALGMTPSMAAIDWASRYWQELLLGGAAFLLVLAVLTGVVLVAHMRQIARSKRLRARLSLFAAGDQTRVLRLWHEGKERSAVVPVTHWRKRLAAHLHDVRADLGTELSMRALVLSLLGLMVLAMSLVLLAGQGPLLALLASLAVLLAGAALVKRRIVRNVALFERQLVDALALAGRSLRAGHPLVGAFEMVAQEMPAPVATVFAEICQQQAMGLGLEEALRRAAEHSSSVDLKLFATSVAIQLRSGGNLADMMDRLGAVIHDRLRLRRHARVLTAQTQLSTRILLALPVVLFLALQVIRPTYLSPLLETPQGRTLLLLAGAGVLVGAWMMKRMTRVRW